MTRIMEFWTEMFKENGSASPSEVRYVGCIENVLPWPKWIGRGPRMPLRDRLGPQ